MANHIRNGRQLSFKPYSGKRGPGRWLRKIDGKAVYFGTGDGATDTISYEAALQKYHDYLAANTAAANAAKATTLSRQMYRHMALTADDGFGDPPGPDMQALKTNVPALRELIGEYEALTGQPHRFNKYADYAERQQRLAEIAKASLDELRRLEEAPATPTGARKAVDVIDEFLAAQRKRMEARKRIVTLRAQGQVIPEGKRENMSPARFSRLAVSVADFKRVVSNAKWDGTEAIAARLVKMFRDWSHGRMLQGERSAGTVNEDIQTARQFVGWCESQYILDRIPRDRSLFTKYAVETKAKAMPLDIIQRMFAQADDRGRAFILLSLNCGYYNVDLSDLTAEQIKDGYLYHRRGKTGQIVKYKLWNETAKYLKRVTPAAGVVFKAETGAPLVHFPTGKNGLPCRCDNVRLWFNRLCEACTPEVAIGKDGYSFSHLRDTAATAVEEIDASMTDVFLAHADRRVAKHYIDGEKAGTAALDNVIDQLEKRFLSIWAKPRKRTTA